MYSMFLSKKIAEAMVCSNSILHRGTKSSFPSNAVEGHKGGILNAQITYTIC